MKRWTIVGVVLNLTLCLPHHPPAVCAQTPTPPPAGQHTRPQEPDRLRALEEENQTLRAAAEAAERKLKYYAEAAAQLVAQAEARATEQARSNAVLHQRVEELERRLAELGTQTARLRELEQELEQLRQQLGETRQALEAQTAAAAQADAQLTNLRARLAVLEAEAVPYTDEERALWASARKASAPPQSAPLPTAEGTMAPPPGTEKLMAEALRDFRQNRLEAAEAKLRQILELDQKNVLILANLATVEFARGQLDAADQHIQQAVRLAPADGFSLVVLGKVKLARNQYDEALEALSRAAEVEPQNAEVQNLLGIALSEKGQRKPAEAALRRALQLEPGYAEAHNNLAFVYLLQNPPAAELARWHYQKAREAGHPRNPALEEKLKEAGAPVSP